MSDWKALLIQIKNKACLHVSKTMLKKRNLTWDYFIINPEDEKNAISSKVRQSKYKNFNTSNLRYHLKQEHWGKHDKLEVKEAERSNQKETEETTSRERLTFSSSH